MANIYILSGPAGVGKSTTAKVFAKTLKRSSLISGDVVSWFHKNGREKPWLSETETALIWANITSIAKNFLLRDIDVIIDYVAFPKDVLTLLRELETYYHELKYIVFMCDEKTLIQRDMQREQSAQMGVRSIELLQELKEAAIPSSYIFDTTNFGVSDLSEIIHTLQNEARFLCTNNSFPSQEGLI
jgi:dephospho-CoA kinase